VPHGRTAGTAVNLAAKQIWVRSSDTWLDPDRARAELRGAGAQAAHVEHHDAQLEERAVAVDQPRGLPVHGRVRHQVHAGKHAGRGRPGQARERALAPPEAPGRPARRPRAVGLGRGRTGLMGVMCPSPSGGSGCEAGAWVAAHPWHAGRRGTPWHAGRRGRWSYEAYVLAAGACGRS